jgi:hypothetical protein
VALAGMLAEVTTAGGGAPPVSPELAESWSALAEVGRHVAGGGAGV